MQTLCDLGGLSVNILARRGAWRYPETVKSSDTPYVLDEQIGYVLRRVTQRHLALFSEAIPEVTTTQFAVLVRLREMGPLSQNHLGRAAALDAATIKGVVDRLTREGYVTTAPAPNDRRRLVVTLSDKGCDLLAERLGVGLEVSDRTYGPLNGTERATLLALLQRLT